MKLILSRKGFDSGSGGCPSPIFPDGSMVSLPIPDKTSPVCYEDLKWRGRALSEIISTLNGAKPKPHHFAHLDPDLVEDFQPRHPDWKPVLGQSGAAQGHLRNEGVGPGDLFLFFGLFRRVDEMGHFVRSESPRHVVWGWLQVDRVIKVDQLHQDLTWAGRHPHIGRPPDPTNTLYRATDSLLLPDHETGAFTGAGVFEHFHTRLQLTDPDVSGSSIWKLPSWFSPSGRASALSYHGNHSRWHQSGDEVRLQTVGRGQEFVLNTMHYPESITWVLSLFG